MKQTITVETHLLTEFDYYSPDALREIARKMDDKGIKSLSLRTHCHYDSSYLSCNYERLETDEEQAAREATESRRDKEQRQRELMQLEQLMKKYPNKE